MKSFFIAFSVLSSRTKRLAEKLGISVVYYRDKFPYIFSLIIVLTRILQEKPAWIILQATQGPIVFIFSILKRILKFKLIADLHTGLLIHISIKSKILNQAFIKFLNGFDLILIHNNQIRNIVPLSVKNKCFLLYDPLLEDCESFNFKKEKLFVFTTIMLKPDEKLDDLVKAADHLKKDVAFMSTGKNHNLNSIKSLGFLSYSNYLRVMKTADVVLAMTKREYTSLSILFEAISLGKCIIASNTNTLKEICAENVLYFSNHDDLIKNINLLKNEKVRIEYENRVKNLRVLLKNIEEDKINFLKNILLKF